MQALTNRFLYKVRDQLGRFSKDQQGVSAIEFAIILPLMIFLAIGTWELTQAIMVSRKNSNLATSIANLATQDSEITASDWTTFGDIAEKILYPYDNLTHRIGMIAVKVDKNSNLDVICRYGSAPVDASTLPTGMRVAERFYIMTAAEVDYLSFSDTFSAYGVTTGIGDMTFRDTAIFSPRNTEEISCK